MLPPNSLTLSSSDLDLLAEAIATKLAAMHPVAINQQQAAARTGLSAKTLSRAADRGEPVGRFREGNRVLFHVETLDGWLKSRAGQHATNHESNHNPS